MDNAGALSLLVSRPQRFLISNMIFEVVPPTLATTDETRFGIDKKWDGDFCTGWGLRHSSDTFFGDSAPFPAYVVPVQKWKEIAVDRVQGITLSTGGANLAVTTQLSGCSIAWEVRGKRLTLAHIWPSDKEGGYTVRDMLLAGNGTFADSDAPFNVFGPKADDLDAYDNNIERCNVIGVLIRGAWALFGQVTNGPQRHHRVLRVVPIHVPW